MNIDWVRIALVILVAYLLGSLPTAYVLGRLRNINIFEVGSGNMGATNISRSMGLGWGVLTWFLDSAKGIAAILISHVILPQNIALATTLAAIAAVVGHNWSAVVALITGTLRGGKGAATAFGTLLMIAPVQALVGVAVALAIVVLTRFVSLGVLVMFALASVWSTLLILGGSMEAIYSLYIAAIALLIFVRFRDNIRHLLAGTERKLGERA